MKNTINKLNLRILGMSIMLTVIFTSASCSSAKRIKQCRRNPVELQLAFEKAHKAVQQALDDANDDNWDLEQADLSFSNVSTVSAEGGLKVYIVSGKFTASSSNSNKMTFSFKKDEEKSLIKEKGTEKLQDFIKTAIISANATTGKDGFTLQEVEIDVEFTITCGAGLGAELELVPITPSLDFSVEKEVAHSVTLLFKRKSRTVKS